MKKVILKIFCFAVLLAFCSSIQVFAIQEDELEDKYPGAIGPATESLVPIQKLDDFDYYFSMDLNQGYDNNVNLDPQRNDDGFFQATASAELSYKKLENLTLNGGLDFFNITYYRYSENSLVNLTPYVGFDWELAPNFIWKNKAALDYYLYPQDNDSTYLAVNLSSYLRQIITESLYHEFGYEYIHRWYAKDKVLLTDRTLGTDNRINSRNKVTHNIRANFENFSAKLTNEFYLNESNYDYQDYYDYWAYRLRPSITYYFSDKFYSNVSFTYRYTDYKDRRNSEDSNEKVYENTYIATASVYFDLTKEFTMGITYSYRENRSNDPVEKYSGSTVSAGVYYFY